MSSTSTVLLLVAAMATVLALGAALAHAYEAPAKLGLAADDYFTVQQIYSGWNRIAFVLAVQFLAIVGVIVAHRDQPYVAWPAAIAVACLILSQVVFWTWTYPANEATRNWTATPQDWDGLRSRWELSHIAGAVLQLGAMTALVLAAIWRKGH